MLLKLKKLIETSNSQIRGGSCIWFACLYLYFYWILW